MESSFDNNRAVILLVTDPMTTWLFSQTGTILSVVNNFNVISSSLTLVFMSRCFLYSLIRLNIIENACYRTANWVTNVLKTYTLTQAK